MEACRLAWALRSESHPLHVIATVTGTENDPQCRSRQIAELEDAGVVVVDSLPEAALLAVALISPQRMAEPAPRSSLLDEVAVINAGLRSFAIDLQSAGTPVVHYQWAPIAGGNKKLARLLERLQ